MIHQGSARQGSSYVRQYKGSAKFQSRRCGNGSVDSDSSDRVRQALAVVVNVRSVPMVVPCFKVGASVLLAAAVVF